MLLRSAAVRPVVAINVRPNVLLAPPLVNIPTILGMEILRTMPTLFPKLKFKSTLTL